MGNEANDWLLTDTVSHKKSIIRHNKFLLALVNLKQKHSNFAYEIAATISSSKVRWGVFFFAYIIENSVRIDQYHQVITQSAMFQTMVMILDRQ